jgi:hypothetical protein
MRNLKRLTLALLAVGVTSWFYNLGANEMFQVKFDMSKNIIETAKGSGAPRWATRDIEGFISYDLVNMPADIPLVYTRAGYEISAMPLYSFTMYADKHSNNNLAVETANLLFHTRALKTHDVAKHFVENLVSQFQRGKWKRYIDELCPAVTGRSSFLDETGKVDTELLCPLDPACRLSSEEWISLMYMGKGYEWMGDGVLATLSVKYSDDIRGITYSIDLKFDDVVVKTRRDEANRLRDLAEGDANGWKSTENETKGIAELKLKNKLLEENARMRGDAVAER